MIERKQHANSKIGTIRFAALWTLVYGLGWGTLIIGGIIASNTIPDIFNMFPLWVFFGLFGLVPGFISSVGQQWLIKRKMNIRIPFWWLWSTIMWTISGALLRFLEYWPREWTIYDERLALTLVFSALFVPPALVQAWLLRKHIRRAWMWPIAAIVSSSTFILPLLASSMMNEVEGVLTFAAAGLMQGAVMALSLLWLIGMANGEKSKKDFAEQEWMQTDDIRWQRLEAIKNDTEAEHIVDDDGIAWEERRF